MAETAVADETVFQPGPPGVRPGVRLNGIYEIERLIAQGGMGEVYKGFNIQTGDPVAIKMIRAGDVGEPRRTRVVSPRGLDAVQPSS